MRGKERSIYNEREAQGITPAYAGKSIPQTPLMVKRWDHPRVCGEKAPRQTLDFAMLGSPPRMRGKGGYSHGHTTFFGITPAYAGKSLTILILYTDRWDHPRVCGEKPTLDNHAGLPLGSPPRMRGKAQFFTPF